MKHSFWAVLCLLLVSSCQSELPTERYYQYEIGFKKSYSSGFCLYLPEQHAELPYPYFHAHNR